MKRVIKCENNVFNPDAGGHPVPFVIEVGDTVEWHNGGNGIHNCVSTGNPKLPKEVPDFVVGATSIEIGPFTTATDEHGIKYTCTHHPGMDGVLRVALLGSNRPMFALAKSVHAHGGGQSRSGVPASNPEVASGKQLPRHFGVSGDS